MGYECLAPRNVDPGETFCNGRREVSLDCYDCPWEGIREMEDHPLRTVDLANEFVINEVERPIYMELVRKLYQTRSTEDHNAVATEFNRQFVIPKDES